MKGIFIAIGLIGCLAMTMPVFAQDPRGIIEGTVTDDVGALVPEVFLTIRLKSGGEVNRIKIRSGRNGEFREENLPFGSYEVTASVDWLGRTFSKVVEVRSAAEPSVVKMVLYNRPCQDEAAPDTFVPLTADDQVEIVSNLITHFYADKKVKNDEARALTPDNFEIKWLTSQQRTKLSAITLANPRDLTQKPDKHKYYSIHKLDQRGGCVAVEISGKDSTGSSYEYRKVDNLWTGIHYESVVF